MTFADRYCLMTKDQASSRKIAEWLRDPLFAAYVREQHSRSA